jgi:hypothetical protein
VTSPMENPDNKGFYLAKFPEIGKALYLTERILHRKLTEYIFMPSDKANAVEALGEATLQHDIKFEKGKQR